MRHVLGTREEVGRPLVWAVSGELQGLQGSQVLVSLGGIPCTNANSSAHGSAYGFAHDGAHGIAHGRAQRSAHGSTHCGARGCPQSTCGRCSLLHLLRERRRQVRDMLGRILGGGERLVLSAGGELRHGLLRGVVHRRRRRAADAHQRAHDDAPAKGIPDAHQRTCADADSGAYGSAHCCAYVASHVGAHGSADGIDHGDHGCA